jgi:mono/diheme cytochrome c family protein
VRLSLTAARELHRLSAAPPLAQACAESSSPAENRYVSHPHSLFPNLAAPLLALTLASTAPTSSLMAAQTTAPASHDDSLVARGKYVATLGDCMACHTAKGGRPYAGGAALKSALGILYGPNITPDDATGIGTWSKSDFERALRLGVDKEGSYLYPAMPYDAYTKMTAADMDALWAYLKTVPAVHNTPPKNTLPFPFTIRQGLAVWQSAYFTPGPFEPDAHKSAQWNRGAYLVEALEHCSECHTPRNAAQGLENQHLLAGAQISGWYAPDISNDKNSTLNSLSTGALANLLKTGTMAGNVKVFGPMQETVHDSLQHVKNSDLTAIAVYLKDQPTIAEPESAGKVKLPAARLADGRRVYEDACSGCHQANGEGIAGSVPALAGNASVTAGEPYNIIMAVLEGFPPQGTWGAMGSFANSLSDDQIADVANFVRTAWGNGAAPNATPWSVGTWRKNASANNESHALLCPNLATDVVQPALREGPAALKQAAADSALIPKLVSDYRAARPNTSAAQVVEALSAAYCRAVASDRISEARMSAQISDFAQRIAVALGDRKPTG